MESKSLISIIIPVYNVEKYLAQCLNSIIHQTYQHIEVICVNDGSLDNSKNILEEYASKDNRIKIISQDNQGLSAARNRGMREASGKYLMFVDSDDWIDLCTCEKAISLAEKNNADLVFWSYTREYDGVSKEKLLFWKDETVFDEIQVKTELHRRLAGLLGEELKYPDYANAIETAWGKLYLTSELIENQIKFVDTKEIGTEDALFNLYVLGYVKKAVYIRKCFNHYRKNNNTSLTSKYKKNLYSQWQHLFDLLAEYITVNRLPYEYEQALNNRIALSILGLGLNILTSDYSKKKKIELIKNIIRSDRYQKAYKALEFKYFPIHWKVFYQFAKSGNAIGVYLLLTIIHNIIS